MFKLPSKMFDIIIFSRFSNVISLWYRHVLKDTKVIFGMEKIKISDLGWSLFQCPWNESRVWRNRYFRLVLMFLLWFLLFLILNTVLIMVILAFLHLSCNILFSLRLYKNFLDSLFFDLVQNLWLEERLFNRCFFLLNFLLLFLFLIFLFHQVNILIP